jgi:hypothetical protein
MIGDVDLFFKNQREDPSWSSASDDSWFVTLQSLPYLLNSKSDTPVEPAYGGKWRGRIVLVLLLCYACD